MVTERHNRTVRRLQWLIHLRWAVAISLATIPVALNYFKFVSLKIVPFFIISVLLSIYNLLTWLYTRRIEHKRGVIIDSPEVVVFLNAQITLDFLFISATVYFSGGLQSPIIFFFIFHMLTACILLSPRHGYLYSSFALLLVSIIGLLQYNHLVPSAGLTPLLAADLTHPLLIIASLITLGALLYLTTYLINHFFKMSLEEQQAFNELTTLFEIGKTISSSLRLDDTLKLVLDNAIKVTGTEAGSIALLDESSNKLAIKAAEGFSEDFMHTHRWKIRPDGMTAKILGQTEPFILTDTLKESTFNNPIALQEGIRSLIAVPLCFNDKIIGILYVDDFEPRTFSESELRLVSILATQAAIAINNAQMHEKAKWLAITDGLTEVYNHRFFQEELSKEIKRTERYNHSLSIIMMDVDYFKDYNDFFGHKKGDEVLKVIGRLLTQFTRKSDFVARYGGDEFVVMLPETPKEKALELAERIRLGIERNDLLKGDGFKIGNLTISLGVASYPNDAKTASELVDKVDQVLYLAKKAGKNKACSLDGRGNGLYCIPRGLKKPD